VRVVELTVLLLHWHKLCKIVFTRKIFVSNQAINSMFKKWGKSGPFFWEGNHWLPKFILLLNFCLFPFFVCRKLSRSLIEIQLRFFIQYPMKTWCSNCRIFLITFYTFLFISCVPTVFELLTSMIIKKSKGWTKPQRWGLIGNWTR
jgi:hypothetical protein